ncbi:MAG TPA: peptide MFS transporter [Polyangiaceae bacterium]|nr:peptide MFS transporter [Polyangiaceae bacterium]
MTRHSVGKKLSERTLGEHPLGLYVLFFTEMWERFCYYGMRALLVYYMTKMLFLPETVGKVAGHSVIVAALTRVFGEMSSQALASQIYGLYTGLVYLTPIAGGYFADRFLGQRKTVVIGGVLMALGEFLMMSPRWFYVALLLLIVGNGFFKPNISTQVGNLYPKGDHRRDRAFMIFYVGINLGAFMSPFVCGTLGESKDYGWAWGFGSAGVGLLLGLAIYLAGQGLLAPDSVMKKKAALEEATKEPKAPKEALYREPAERPKAPVDPSTIDAKKASDGSRIGALLVLCALNVVFWGVYEQQGNTLALWADNNTNRFIGSWEVPASWFQAVNPAMIFLFTPFINALWRRQAKRDREPTSVTKMAIGCFLLGISFLVMIGGARVVDSGRQASMGWFVGCTAILTLGELYLSPVGLSLVTKISPPRIVSLMMGMWFVSSFFGNYMSGLLGTLWEKMSKGSFFLMLSGLSFATGIVMLLLMVPLKRAIGDENARDDDDAEPAA